ncbi:hypothetical protein [Cellvibrio fibrivorans]|uniref:RiboL-PSP-HEPN domain-containing protein n=1 Tax=Cellvibrio fibrivorans TaxID=126350 RepID=A0ABU1UTU1_9GAMM|nr:hypothetical protein [Cellvibrio fibrivorans]MDR7088604.1 hypothetical protein [Cellvibrio fibrivorans]
MAGVKDSMIQSAESLADALGITPEELDILHYEIDTEESSDGLIYCYRLEFSEECPLHILDKILGLEDGRVVRVNPAVFDYERYDYEERFNAVTDNDSPIDHFSNELACLKKLLELPVSPDIEPILYRQIFISTIGLMETFLSDTFINQTMDEDIYFRNFISTHPEFGKRKFELRDIFKESEKLKDSAKIVMLDMIYHKLPEVREMYRSTFEMDFPSIKTMFGYVRDRHDLVHRSGKRKDGSLLVIEKSSLLIMISDTESFIDSVAKNMSDSYINLIF